MEQSALKVRTKSLEDAFFAEKDRKLVEQHKRIRKMEDTKQSLAAVSGIKNDAVLQKLVELDIQPQTLASLALIPLIEVAWADGAVDEKEKSAVLKAAETVGFRKGDVDRGLLDEWLTRKPEPQMLAAWASYVNGLCELLPERERTSLRDEVLGHAEAVARSAGSLLGLTSGVSGAEKEMLEKLSKAFEQKK